MRLPGKNLLGEEGKGFYPVMKNFQDERIALAAKRYQEGGSTE